MKTPIMIMLSKAVFLDRDGVINKERKDYVKNIEELEIFGGVAEAIKLLKNNNYLVIVITNQSPINRGILSIEKLNEIHNQISEYLKINNTSIDQFYYCPHTPDEGCFCRKPKPGLLLKASQDFKIDLKKSHLIGDKNSDIEAAKNAGCNWIRLQQDQSLLQIAKQIINSN